MANRPAVGGIAQRPANSVGREALRHAATILGASVALGVSLWLSSAAVVITGWVQQKAERIGIFPPLSRLWWSVAAAACVGGAILLVSGARFKSLQSAAYVMRPLLALWLWAIPYLPWIPDKFPLLLVLAGPIRWIVAGAALLAVAVRLVRSTGAARPWPLPPRAAVLVLSLVIYALAGSKSFSVAGMTGDEPHYLIITESLLRDGDLRIQNNHTRRDHREFYPGELRPDSIRRGMDGEIYPNKAPGLPALLAPAYRVAGARGAIVALAFIAALAALAVFDVGLLIGGRHIAWAIWAGTCLTVPFIPHAWSIYPDIVAAAVAAWTVKWLLTAPPDALWRWAGRGLCLVLLPWLHTRLAVLFVGLTACLLIRFRSRLRQCVAMLAPISIGIVAWLVFFYAIYGTYDPRVVWGGATSSAIRLANVPRGIVGLLFDQKFGLLVYAPFFILVAAGVVPLARVLGRTAAVMLGLTTVAYVINCAQMYTWWGGSSAPARFLVPVVPVLSPFLAAALGESKSNVRGAVARATLGLSLIISAVAVMQPARRILFSPPHGTSELVRLVEDAVPLTSMLPIFTETAWHSSLLTLLPWIGAALFSLLVAHAVRQRNASFFGTSVLIAVIFLASASAVTARVPREARTQSEIHGRLALINAFDPGSRTGFDYVRLATLTERDWLQKASLSFDGPAEAGLLRTRQADARRDGTISQPMPLPQGRYEAVVWSRSSQPAGHLQVSAGRGQILARSDAPLGNPARLVFELPVGVPALRIEMSDPASSQEVLRAQLTPLSIVAAAKRSQIPVRVVESISGHIGSYVVYVDDGTFPERGGTFWTRGTASGRIRVRPAGARQLVLNLSTGPRAQTVHVSVGGDQRQVQTNTSESQSLVFDLRDGMDWIAVEVQSSAAFRPMDVDPRSFDNRSLGCYVRLELR